MYVCMHAGKYYVCVCMYVCMNECMHACTSIYAWMYVRMHAYMCECMQVFTYVCFYVCIYVRMYMFVYVCIKCMGKVSTSIFHDPSVSVLLFLSSGSPCPLLKNTKISALCEHFKLHTPASKTAALHAHTR